MAHIFISHKSEDASRAEEVRDCLKGLGYSSFLSFHPEDGIPAGAEWERKLYDEIRRADAVIALISKPALGSHWIAIELAFARARDRVIIPLQLGGAANHPMLDAAQSKPWPDRAPLPAALLRQGLAHAGLEASLDWDEDHPYVGLRPLEMSDAGVFFGREEEIRDLVDRFGQGGHTAPRRLIPVIGASGSGKSSLVRAGLAVRLTKTPGWVVLPPMTPRTSPFDELARVIARARHGEAEAGAHRIAYRDEIDLADAATGGERLGQLMTDIVTQAGQPDGRVLLVIDQAEELLSDNEATVQRSTRFLDVVAAGLQSPLRVALVFRSQDLESLQEIAPPGLLQAPYLVDPLDDSRLHRVIMGPAEKVGLDYAPGLVDEMVRQAAGGDLMPLLAFALQRLYEEGGEDDSYIDEREFRTIGGVNEAIATKANEVYEAHGKSPSVIEAMLELVAMYPGKKDPDRRRVDADSLSEDTVRILGQFVDARLVTSGRGPDNDTTFELAHEAVFRKWEPLRDAIRDNTRVIEVRTRLQPDADAWKQRGERDEDLARRRSLADIRNLGYYGRPSADAIQFVERKRRALGDRVADYLVASVKLERKRRWLWRIARVALVVLAAAIAVVAYAAFDRYQTRQSATGPTAGFPAGAAVFADIEYVEGFPSWTGDLIAGQVGAFDLDLHEVTNAQYRACMKVGKCTRPRQPGNFAGIDDPDAADLPVVYVDAFQARDFCTWIGRRLPDRREWERAARGSEGRAWPWASDAFPDPTRANLLFLGSDPALEEATGGPIEVEALPEGASPEGVTHLVGNVSEWTATPAHCTGACPPRWDRRADTSVVTLSVVGLSWDSQLEEGDADILAITYGGEPVEPIAASDRIGFRCAN